MYPADDLALLQREKLLRIQRSAELRGEITSACATLAYPVSVAEQVIVTLKKFAPYVSLAAPFFRKKSNPESAAARRPNILSTALRWAPTVLHAIKIFRASRQSTTTSSHASS
ncbi:MAG TPA: hypothetical protein VIM69_06435 [Opitutaceae bacterium]